MASSIELHADALHGLGPLWATHPPVPWGMDTCDEIPTAGFGGKSSGDAPVRGRHCCVNQSALPLQGCNVSKDEWPPGSCQASLTSDGLQGTLEKGLAESPPVLQVHRF